MTPLDTCPQTLPALIIVSGPPGTGKTYLARQMAQRLCLPLLSKDTLKESLYETLGWSDRAWSMRLGRACTILLYQLAETLLAAQASCIIESNFTPALASPELRDLQARCRFKPIQVVCWTDPGVLVARLKERIRSGIRHPGHVEDLNSPTLTPEQINWRSEPMDIGGVVFEVNTTHFTGVDYDGLFAQVKAALA